MLSKSLNEVEKLSPFFNFERENDIVEILSNHLGFDKKVIESHNRRQEIVRARSLIVYLLREYSDLSYSAIGRLLGGRDHTTIMHEFKEARRSIQVHPELKEQMKELMQKIGLIKRREELHVVHYSTPEVLVASKAKVVSDSQPISRNISERNSKVLDLWRGGLSLQNVSNVFGLTRERVRQIVYATIKQMSVNESVSRGIVMDFKVLIEEEIKKRNILQESKKEKVIPVKKEKRWSTYYSACRLCNTTAMPHVRHGLCEKCSGQYRGDRRKNIIDRYSNSCSICGISYGDAIKKYGRDFYITKSQQVLCRGCFLKNTGEKLGKYNRQNKKTN